MQHRTALSYQLFGQPIDPNFTQQAAQEGQQHLDKQFIWYG